MTTAYASGPRTSLVTFVINAGDTLSEEIHIGVAKYATLHLPAVTSCAMYIRSAPTHTGSYYRVQNNAMNGDYTIPCSAGLVVYSLPERFTALDHVKLESSVTQASTVTISAVLGW